MMAQICSSTILAYLPKGYSIVSHWCDKCTWYTPTHLVGGLEHFVYFHILGTIISTDFHIFQRGWNHQPVMFVPCIDVIHVWCLVSKVPKVQHIQKTKQKTSHPSSCHNHLTGPFVFLSWPVPWLWYQSIRLPFRQYLHLFLPLTAAWSNSTGAWAQLDLEDDHEILPGVAAHMTHVINHLCQTIAATKIHRLLVLVRLQCALHLHFRTLNQPPGLDLDFNWLILKIWSPGLHSCRSRYIILCM